ncbi:3002_t:CDS:1, partial [Racocetra fulgida]
HGNTPAILRKLLQQANKFLEPQSSYDRKLQKIWENFVSFCQIHRIGYLPATKNAILAYLVWVVEAQEGPKPSLILLSVAWAHVRCGFEDPTKQYD